VIQVGAGRYAGSGVRLGIDFGTTLTKVAVFEETTGTCHLLALPPLSRGVPCAGTGQDVPVIPSRVHFPATGSPLFGAELGADGRGETGSSLTGLKHYLLTDSPVRVPAGDRTQCSAKEAGSRFLVRVLTAAIAACGCQPTQVVFTLPADAPPHYEDWIAQVAASSGIRQFFVLDECSAVLLGMGVQLVADHPVLVVDCGGVSCSVTIGMQEKGAGTGSRIRVVGKAKSDGGGTGIDGWLASATGTYPLSGTGHGGMPRRDSVPEGAYERAKELLSIAAEVEIPLASAGQYPAINTRITRATLEQVLTDRGFFATLERTIDRALAAARMRGYTPEEICTVVLAGGSGAIPAVLEAVRRKFPRCPVVCDRPAWAAARGAATFRPGSSAAARIRNDYALQYWDPVTLSHGYRFLVRGGTPYPSAGQVARLVISAAYDGQTHLGIPLFEYRTGDGDAPCRSIELVGATGGGLQCADAATTPSDQHPPVWVNEQVPMFLVADPPAQKGEPRFEVTFTIDGTRQLAVTARDMRTGRLIKEAEPLFRLT